MKFRLEGIVMNNTKRSFTRVTGFSLVELLVVIAIIGVLASIAIPAYSNYVAKSKIQKAFADVQGLKSQIGLYFAGLNPAPPASPTGKLDYLKVYKLAGSTATEVTSGTAVANTDTLKIMITGGANGPLNSISITSVTGDLISMVPSINGTAVSRDNIITNTGGTPSIEWVCVVLTTAHTNHSHLFPSDCSAGTP